MKGRYKMGLPKIEIIFKQKAITAIKRSALGIVALIVKDDTNKTFTMREYKNITDIVDEEYSAENIKLIKDTFTFTPAKVIVVRIDLNGKITDALKLIQGLKVNWLGLAKGIKSEQQEVATWIKSMEKIGKTFKAIVFNADTTECKHIVNFGTEKVTFKDERAEQTGDKYIPALLGLFAGLPLTRSGTYYNCSNLAKVSQVDNVDELIDKGKLLLINDEGDVRIARAVNSISEVTQDITEDMKDIIIIESMDMMTEDIRETFKTWIGKYKNKYENQVLFISSVNSYFRQLMKEDVLDNEYHNHADVDVDSQRLAWLSVGKTEAEQWDIQKVKTMSFKKTVFLLGDIKILNAVEDFKFHINLF